VSDDNPFWVYDQLDEILAEANTKMADNWDKYDKETKEKLQNHPAIIGAVNQMARDGHTKEHTQKITGAPYEVVDRIYKNLQRQRKPDSGPRSDETE
jgi:NH3-dependent NAD+ synthetase